jgi:hypothetical protein
MPLPARMTLKMEGTSKRLKLLDVPTHICLIAGDMVYNMRASLDQLVWGLARLKGIPKHTAFPVVDGPVLTKDK